MHLRTNKIKRTFTFRLLSSQGPPVWLILTIIFCLIYISNLLISFFCSSLSVHMTSGSLYLSLWLFLSQYYDLGSPADSSGSAPGCLMTDSSCVNMGFPSCGTRGRCHGEWGSFSCQCTPGYSGHQCEKGNYSVVTQSFQAMSIFTSGRWERLR